jgi:Phage integrase family
MQLGQKRAGARSEPAAFLEDATCDVERDRPPLSTRTRRNPWIPSQLLTQPADRARPRRWPRPAGPLAEASDGAAGGGGVRRRFAPHRLRHAHAVEMAREGVPLNVIQRQLGHADLGITSVYLQGIDGGEIVDIAHGRRAPVIQAAVALGP